jgi:hypothetical protein
MRVNVSQYFKTLFHLLEIIFLATVIFSPAHAAIFQAPLIVDDAYIQANGNIITGNYLGTTSRPAITIATSNPVIITHALLQGPGDLIQGLLVPVNLTITNTTGIGINPNIRNAQKGIFLHVISFTNINMQNNTVNGLRLGFFCKAYAGNNTTSNTLVIAKNSFINMDARPSDGKGSYETTGQYNGQAIHLGNIFGVPGIDIGWNNISNIADQSSTGALIELNETSGTASSPVQIHDNFISGAFPTYPGKDLYDFGGILINGLATDTAETVSSFINVTRNYVIATANYGIALVVGHDITMSNNRVVSSGYLADGKTFYPMSTYGDAAGAININLYNQPASVFFNNIITNNVLGLVKNNGKNQPVRSDWNLPGQGGAVAGNISYDSAGPTVANEAQELSSWQMAALANNSIIGDETDVGYVPDSLPLTASAPVSISTGSAVVLDHIRVSNPSGTCVFVGSSITAPITITNSEIGPCGGEGILVSGSGNVIIKNNYIHDVTQHGIQSAVVAKQTIQNNTVENSGFGIYVVSNKGAASQANVDYNKIVNVTGISGQNVSALQFNQITGPNSTISCNVYNQPVPPPSGLTGTGDSFNLFLSSGTSDSPIQVVGNRIMGGGAVWNGGGILLSDGDTGPGTMGPGYVYAGDNYVVNPGGYGIDVSTGHDIKIDSNHVYGNNNNFYTQSSSSYGPGRIGINTFNVYSSSCSNITVTNNTVYYLSSLNGNGSTVNYGLDTGACNPTTQANNVGYNVGDNFTYPSFDLPTSSCTEGSLHGLKGGKHKLKSARI